ncbi:facilitated trehalose transporter Tret1-like [Schistocerca serialis cubense]|uniref:facilitated trehalose transporter Tret1-like n=1 Tax=Schistocerca serialis cubense TaxID=2023355 RepID=UPI00214E344F|nr:facilitated trehalose transporter Tret1-like [Schistocerca serialis cubense]
MEVATHNVTIGAPVETPVSPPTTPDLSHHDAIPMDIGQTHGTGAWADDIEEDSEKKELITVAVMDKPSLIRRRLPQLFAALSATLGGFCLGTVLGWSSPAGPLLEKELELSEETVSWCGGIMPLGALAAMVMGSFTLDRVGRRLPLLCLAPPFVLGWMLLSFCKDAWVLLVGRFITGFCGGAFCTACPVYTGEISEKEIRGALGVCFQFMVTSATKVASGRSDVSPLGFARLYRGDCNHALLASVVIAARGRDDGWRATCCGPPAGILYVYVVGKWSNLMWLSLLCSIPPILFFVLFFFVPESPIFLLSQDKTENATVALRWLRGGANADINADLAEMTETVAHARARKGKLKDMFVSHAAGRCLGIGLGLQFSQQLSGINIIIFYSVSIFVSAGSRMDPSDCAIIVGVVQVLATFLSTVLVECAGRRIWMMLSMSGMGICLLLMGVYFNLKNSDPETADHIGWLPLLSMCLYLLFFSLGAGPLPWVVIGEIFPGEIKGIAASICGGTNWTLAFIVSKTFVNLVGAIGTDATFWLYSGICFLATVWIFFRVIETRNKTLDEITKEIIGE